MWKRVFFLLGMLLSILVLYEISNYEAEVEQQEITVEHVREAIDLSRDTLAKIVYFYNDVKSFPVDNKEAGLPFPNQITSENVKSVTVIAGRVTVTFKKHLQQGVSFTFKPEFTRTEPITLEWRCEPGVINKQFFQELMPSCMVTGSDLAKELRQAVYESSLDNIEQALDRGAEINNVLYGETALSIAISNNKANIVAFLLDNGADIEQVAPRYGSRTPLMMSLTYGNQEIVQLLIDRGADVNAKDDKGKSVLQHVRHSGSVYRKLLIDAGAYEYN